MIKLIKFNWFSTDKHGEEFESRVVGVTYNNKKCVEIKEQKPPEGEGNRFVYDVVYDNGDIERIFNPNIVQFENIRSI